MTIRKFSVALFSVSTFVLAQLPQPTLTQEDLRAVDAYFRTNLDLAAMSLKNQTMSNAPLNPDGSRGYQVTQNFEVGTTAYTGDYEKDSPILLRRDVCGSRAVVIAEVSDGVGVFVHNKQGIVTARSILIRSVLHGNAHDGDTATVVEFGGDLTEGNTTFRVGIEGVKPFQSGKDYLLFLYKDPGHPSHAYFILGYHRDRVVDGKIYPSKRPSSYLVKDPIAAGEPVETFAAALAQIDAQSPCPHKVQ